MDLFDAPWGNSGVNYDVVDPLLFGEKTPEKPGTRGTALMHNFLDGQLTPLFHRVTNKDHKPELRPSPRTYHIEEQIYPKSFCRRVAKLFAVHLETQRASVTTTEDSTYVDHAHLALVEDLLDLGLSLIHI